MMKYYYIMQDDASSDNPVFIRNIKKTADNYIFLSGKKIDNVDYYNVDIENRDGKVEDYLANDIFAPVISEKIKKILENNIKTEEIQFIPLKYNNKNLNENYYIMNVINVVDALDIENSMTGPEIGGRISIIKYALKSNMLEGVNVFRLKKYEINKVCISEKVKTALESAKVTGMSFGNVKVV